MMRVHTNKYQVEGETILSLKKLAYISLVTGVLTLVPVAFTQDRPAPARKPATAAAPASPIDNVIKLLKSGMSEALIVKTLQKQEPYTPSPEEMVKLKEAGASDNLIGVIMDPASAPVTAAAAAEAKGPDCPAPAAVSAATGAAKRRLAVKPFDYSAVKTQVTAIFNNDMNIGEGIRAMLTVKMAQSGSVVLLEREKLNAVMAEQDFGATNRVKQGTKAKIGGITGADAMLFGDIVIFGRDDTAKKNGAAGILGGLPGRVGGTLGNFKKNEKAVVAINLRIVDAETGDIITATEARGESSRTSTNWGGMAAGWKYGTGGAGAGAGSSMTSSNFAATIIGEATQDAVNKIAAFLEQKVPAIAAKSRAVEGKVANIDGCTLYLSVGGNDGVQLGDHFEIHKILSDVLDPDTKEVIGTQTVRVGDFIVNQVRDKVSIGQYGGQALAPNSKYAARMITP
jgi:curli biogenesis system outer membrane secretion channel CsgG